MAAKDLKHLLALIYIIPSLFLYLIMLYIIFIGSSKSKFRSSFYWIFGFSAINYFIHAISYFIVYRFVTISAFSSFLERWPTEHPFYPIIVTITFYTAFANHTFNLAMNFNRFSVFFLKAKYYAFWKRYLKHCLRICIFLPIIFVWNFPFTGIKNIPINGNPAWIAETINKFPIWMDKNRNLFIEILFCSFFSFIMNCYVFYCIIKKRCFVKTKNCLTPSDSTMLSYSIFIFVTEVYSCSQQCLLTINREAFLSFVQTTQFIAADITALAPAWFILVINKPLRKEIKSLFKIPHAEIRKLFLTSQYNSNNNQNIIVPQNNNNNLFAY